MFCLRKGEPALLLWYKDPVSVAHEMRPPAIQLWEETTLYDREIGHPMFTLITHDETFHVSQGPLRLESDGKTVFEDIQKDELHYLDFESCVAKNKRILQRALACSELQDVPDFKSENASLVSPDTLALDVYWVGALAIARAEVTQFLVYYMTADVDKVSRRKFLRKAPAPKLEKVVKKKVPLQLDGSTFFCWYPTARPGNLHNWLELLHNGLEEDKKERVYSELSPIIEGYYRVAPVGKPESSNEQCSILYDDKTLMKSKAYFDTGAKTEDADASFLRPHDKHRGKLTLSTPLCISTAKDEDLGWGFTGMTPLAWLFLLPMRAGKNSSYLMGPVRVPQSGLNRFKRHVKEEREASYETEGERRRVQSMFKPLFVDSELNFGDMPTTTLLSNPSSKEKKAMQSGIKKTFVPSDAVPQRQRPLRGKTVILPRRLLLQRDENSLASDGGEDDPEDRENSMSSAGVEGEDDVSSPDPVVDATQTAPEAEANADDGDGQEKDGKVLETVEATAESPQGETADAAESPPGGAADDAGPSDDGDGGIAPEKQAPVDPAATTAVSESPQAETTNDAEFPQGGTADADESQPAGTAVDATPGDDEDGGTVDEDQATEGPADATKDKDASEGFGDSAKEAGFSSDSLREQDDADGSASAAAAADKAKVVGTEEGKVPETETDEIEGAQEMQKDISEEVSGDSEKDAAGKGKAVDSGAPLDINSSEEPVEHARAKKRGAAGVATTIRRSKRSRKN